MLILRNARYCGKAFGWRSSRRCRIFRRNSVLCSCSSRCWDSRLRKPPKCWKPPFPRSTAHSNERARHSHETMKWNRENSLRLKSEMLNRYLAAFERYDVDELTVLMRHDVTFCMPPYSLWLQGPAEIRTWMLGLGSGCRGSRLVPTAVCGWPAFAQYRPNPEGGHKAWALIVLELSADRIAGVSSFLDTEALFPRFGLPLILVS